MPIIRSNIQTRDEVPGALNFSSKLAGLMELFTPWYAIIMYMNILEWRAGWANLGSIDQNLAQQKLHQSQNNFIFIHIHDYNQA